MSDFRHYLDEQIKIAKRRYRNICNAWSTYRDPMPDARHLEALSKVSGFGPLVKGAIIGVDATATLDRDRKIALAQYQKAKAMLEFYLVCQRVDRSRREMRINRRKARKQPTPRITVASHKYDGV